MSETSEPTFNFDAWISGASISEQSVDVFQNGAVLGKVSEWKRRYKRAQLLAKENTEHSAEDQSELARLEEEGEILLAELEEGKTVWFVRGLTSEEEIAIDAAHPEPADPLKDFPEKAPLFIRNATEKQSEAYLSALRNWDTRRTEFLQKQLDSEEYRQYAEAQREVAPARGAERIRRAFVRIEKNGATILDTPPSVEQLLKLPHAIGEVQIKKIIEAITDASIAEPEVSGDFLHRTSRKDQNL